MYLRSVGSLVRPAWWSDEEAEQRRYRLSSTESPSSVLKCRIKWRFFLGGVGGLFCFKLV